MKKIILPYDCLKESNAYLKKLHYKKKKCAHVVGRVCYFAVVTSSFQIRSNISDPEHISFQISCKVTSLVKANQWKPTRQPALGKYLLVNVYI